MCSHSTAAAVSYKAKRPLLGAHSPKEGALAGYDTVNMGSYYSEIRPHPPRWVVQTYTWCARADSFFGRYRGARVVDVVVVVVVGIYYYLSSPLPPLPVAIDDYHQQAGVQAAACCSHRPNRPAG